MGQMKRRIDRVVAGTCAASLVLGMAACVAPVAERAPEPEAQAEVAGSEGELLGPVLLRGLSPLESAEPGAQSGAESSSGADALTSPSSPNVSSRSGNGEREVNVYDPSEEEPQDLYGPPVVDEPDEWDPADERVEALYGPPPVFDPVNQPVQLLYGPPPSAGDNQIGMSAPFDDYDPSQEIATVLYGPPSMFGEGGTGDADDSAEAEDPAQTGKIMPIVDKLLGRDSHD